MRIIVQRVREAQVTSEGKLLAKQAAGFLLLLGIADGDSDQDITWLVNKIAKIRLFADDEGKMNLSLLDTGGDVTVVSQFTLQASYRKGNRPSFLAAAHPSIAEPLYEKFCAQLSETLDRPVSQGRFGADMQINLINDGPVTLLLDSRNPE